MAAPSGRMLLAFSMRKITLFLRYLISSVKSMFFTPFVGLVRPNRIYAHGVAIRFAP
jgi:hypothetical protein